MSTILADMYLIIDNLKENITLYWRLADGWEKKEFDRSNGLLEVIDSLLTTLGKDARDLKGIVALLGAGTFTQTRVAATVANSLAFALKIPVAGVTDLKIEKIIDLLENTPVGQYISPKYSREANIGGVSS